ncbi:hypothetical protein RND81_11G020700 [Saponaria officinalis]|uniref:Uncharacterized protein n=1 Tax=Saponaria officinalis TaxID=3572 RepID=A0AAW1HHR7_SAPOF
MIRANKTKLLWVHKTVSSNNIDLALIRKFQNKITKKKSKTRIQDENKIKGMFQIFNTDKKDAKHTGQVWVSVTATTRLLADSIQEERPRPTKKSDYERRRN